ncbi:uncharacterized protein [Euphorbia lathyris]|uniref:uncharacterized protein n=1 Tax=Euphorbia lathyris TaxID=212925 RepID=UPI00331434B6
MADMEPPSFSLGLDLDLSTPLQQDSHINPAPATSSHTLSYHEDDDENFGRRDIDSIEEDFGLQVMDSDPESGPDSPRVFKRLRRGPAAEQSGVRFCDNGNDEIEEFSSQEDFIKDDKHTSTYNSIYSTSKVPLCGRGVLTNQLSSQLKEKNKGRTSDAPSSSCLRTGQNGFILPKLTVSPLRKFQLVDSDTEEPSKNKGRTSDAPSSSCLGTGQNGFILPKLTISPLPKFQLIDSDTEEPSTDRKIPGSDSSLKKKKQPSAILPKRNLSPQKHQSEDLWKDFSPMKSFNISTPALDEVCEEYFRSVRDKNASAKLGSHLYNEGNVGYEQDANASSSVKQSWNLADPVPPAHCYFFHDDPRIQILVRSRLPHFFPLGISKSRENQQPIEPVINYMSQFNGEASKHRTTQRKTNEMGSTRGRGRGRGRGGSRKSNAKEAESSVGWVDPKTSTTIPKDAGKRRVQANGQGGGRWYTSPEGKKVYVSKGGQEMSGRTAYRHYKKDNGGFRKSKKKTNAKRKKS